MIDENQIRATCDRRGAILENLAQVASRQVAHVQHRGRKLALPFRSLEELDLDLKNTARRPK